MKSMKSSYNTIGNRPRNLPARSAVPQPTVPLPEIFRYYSNLDVNSAVILYIHYVEIKCQLDATDEFFLLQILLLAQHVSVPLCPSSGVLEYYTSGCCLSYLVLCFQVVGAGWS
jgi:hypothetical protein